MLLPQTAAARSLVAAYATVRATFREDLGSRTLVLPNGSFFPDTFRGDAASAETLVRRMQAHAGMLDIPVRTRIAGSAAAAGTGCGVGCAPAKSGPDSPRLVDTGDDWELTLAREELGHPVALTTLVARSLAVVFLQETLRQDRPVPVPTDVLVDLLGVNLGFGALLMEGAYVYSKSCGGPSVVTLTTLGLPELALSTALFCATQPKALRAAKRSASTTQAAAFGEASAWLLGNRELALQVEQAPELIQGGAFELSPPKAGWFSWLESKPAEPEFPPPAGLLAAKPPRTRKPPPDDGIEELVKEVLGSR